MTIQPALIAGRSQTADRFFEVIHPATLEGTGSVADCGSTETHLAANDAANVTQWRRTPAYQRTNLLLIWRERLLAKYLATKFLSVGMQP